MKLSLFMSTLTAALLTVSACGGPAAEPVKEKSPVRLNEVLTNSLSDTSALYKMDKKVTAYMSKWEMYGAQLTVMRNDSLLYSKGYGWADQEKGIPMEPYHILRMASVSKLVTAVGIMKLKEQGKLSLQDKVFGENGILSDSLFTSAVKDKKCFNITVEHLLRHQGGFSTRGGDPMFSTRELMLRNKLTLPPDPNTLVPIVLKKNLKFQPGKSHDYSNFGYLLLSMIIEKVTGQDYEKWMRRNVLRPAGCYDFQIANNYYKQRHKNESRYYVPSNEPEVEEYNNSGKSVVRCYGGNDIHALSGAGAWVASTAELARFVASIDGKPEVPDILSKESVDEMTRYVDKSTFSLGWNDTNPEIGWDRTGTFSGTAALVRYYPDGECWIFISNTSTWKGPSHARYTRTLFSELRRDFRKAFPARDLFYE